MNLLDSLREAWAKEAEISMLLEIAEAAAAAAKHDYVECVRRLAWANAHRVVIETFRGQSDGSEGRTIPGASGLSDEDS